MKEMQVPLMQRNDTREDNSIMRKLAEGKVYSVFVSIWLWWLKLQLQRYSQH
jgi:hypothetical protein